MKRSVFLCLDNIDYGDIFRQICAEYGDASISAIIPRSGGLEVTFVLQSDANSAMDDGVINGQVFEVLGVANKVVTVSFFEVLGVANKVVTVSFFEVQEYITDNHIKGKLIELGCTLKGPIVWKRINGIYTGIRHVRV